MGGNCWFAPEQQSLGIHVHVRGLSAGGAAHTIWRTRLANDRRKGDLEKTDRALVNMTIAIATMKMSLWTRLMGRHPFSPDLQTCSYGNFNNNVSFASSPSRE